MNNHYSKFLLALLIYIQFFHTNSVQGQRIVDDFNPLIKGKPLVRAMDLQSDGKILLGGKISSVNQNKVNKLVRLNLDGTLDNTFMPIGLAPKDQDDIYKIIVAEDESILVVQFSSPLLVLNSDGSKKESFIMDPSLRETLNVTKHGEEYFVYAFQDGVGEVFTKLNADGSSTSNFSTTGLSGFIWDIDFQSDGKIILIGSLQSLNGQSVPYITRLNPDGSIDDSFNIGTGLNAEGRDIEVQPDDKVLVSGFFTEYNGTSTPGGLIRLNSDGSIDDSFIISTLGNNSNANLIEIHSLSSNKIIAVSQQNGISVFRLNSDGSFDNSYPVNTLTPDNLGDFDARIDDDENIFFGGDIIALNGNTTYGFAAIDNSGNRIDNIDAKLGGNPRINSSAIQDDGKILIGGAIIGVNGVEVNGFTRLNVDGTIDNTFIHDFVTNHDVEITSVNVLSNGQILLAGNTSILTNSEDYQNIIKLNSNGTKDNNFKASVSSGVSSIVIQDDNKIVISGNFDLVDNTLRNKLARLNSDGSLDNTYNMNDFVSTTTLLSIDRLVLQSDEKLVLGGINSGDNDQVFGALYRLGVNGDIDETFTSTTNLFQDIQSLHILGDNSILAGGGWLHTFGEDDLNVLYQLNPNGNIVDNSSIGITGDSFHSDVVVVDDENIIVAGKFVSYNFQEKKGLAKSSILGVVDQNFDFNTNGSVTNILKIDNQHIAVFGNFNIIGAKNLVGAAKIKITNDIPIISGLINSISTNEDTSIELNLSDFQVEDLDDVFPDKHVLIISEGENYTINQNTVIPAENYFGTLSVPVTVSDGKDESTIFNVEIEVVSVNDIPVITEQANLETDEDVSVSIDLTDLIVTDPDHSFPDDFSITLQTGDNYSFDQNNITPDQDFNGTLNVPVIVNDGIDDSETFLVNVIVNPINDAPIIVNQINEINIIKNTATGLIDNSIEVKISDIEVTDVDNSLADLTLSVLDGTGYEVDGNTVISSGDFAGTLTVSVIVNDGESDSAPFNLEVIVSVITSLDNDISKTFIISPNPIKQNLNIGFTDSYFGPISIQVFDLSGQVKYDQTIEKTSELFQPNLRLPDLNSGTYILKMLHSDKLVTKKFIKL